MLALEVDLVPLRRSDRVADVVVAIGTKGRTTELRAGAGHDDDFVVVVLPYLVKGACQFAMR